MLLFALPEKSESLADAILARIQEGFRRDPKVTIYCPESSSEECSVAFAIASDRLHSLTKRLYPGLKQFVALAVPPIYSARIMDAALVPDSTPEMELGMMVRSALHAAYLAPLSFSRYSSRRTEEELPVVAGEDLSQHYERMRLLVQQADKERQQEWLLLQETKVPLFGEVKAWYEELWNYSQVEEHRGYDGSPFTVVRERVREIGNGLNAIGGKALMLDVAERMPIKSQRDLDYCWDGIGDWLA